MLAKDFGHAQLVLQLAETNLFRGQKWYCFGSKSALDSLLVPIPKGMDEFQTMRYQTELRSITTIAKPWRQASRSSGEMILSGGQQYKLSGEEYREFRRYFGDHSGRLKVDFEYEHRGY